MPAIRRSNCMILGAGHLPFVSASLRGEVEVNHAS
jgi:hypothetical protein